MYNNFAYHLLRITIFGLFRFTLSSIKCPAIFTSVASAIAYNIEDGELSLYMFTLRGDEHVSLSLRSAECLPYDFSQEGRPLPLWTPDNVIVIYLIDDLILIITLSGYKARHSPSPCHTVTSNHCCLASLDQTKRPTGN